MIQEWIDGTFTNNGLILVANTELNDGFTYKTSDHATASQRPQLVIEYTTPASPPATSFPATTVLDNFNRANGSIGSNWAGSTSSFSISSNQMTADDGNIYWQVGEYGPDQEAYFTMSNVDPGGDEQGVMLKYQPGLDAKIKVFYDADNEVVEVWTYDGDDWIQHGTQIAVTFNHGDQFGAHVKANGDVEIYKNGILLGVRNVSSWPYYANGGFIGLAFLNSELAIVDDFGGGAVVSGFPATFVVDNFNRANGAIGSNWQGSDTAFTISSNQMDVVGDGAILWQDGPYGADQEAYFTFVNVDENGGEQDLLLKIQSSGSWVAGALEVWYDAQNHVVHVATYEWSSGWVEHGTAIPVTFANGDQFGARALSDGTVEVYKNGTLLASRDITSWQYYDDEGFIGLWFIGSTNAVLDDFGGGTISGGESLMAGSSSENSLSVESESLEVSPALETALDPFNMELSEVDTFWQGIPLNTEQEAVVTFAQINTGARQKPQSNGLWGDDVVQVLYDVPNGRIQVWMYDSTIGWTQQGGDISIAFAEGDQFSAVVQKNGTLQLSRNGKLLAKQKLTYVTPSLVREQTVPQDDGLFQFTSYRPSDSDLAMVGLPVPSIPNLPPLLPLQQTPTTLTIDYTYDALNRLTGATYDDGRSFAYTYDAAGNVLELGQNLGPGTVTTTYTYDDANELLTAQVDGTTWNYTYDANGSLTEVLPNGNPGNGAKRYTYNVAGNLMQVEAHNGSTWDVQAEMDYNGLGQRLSMDAAGVIAYYVMNTSTGLTSSRWSFGSASGDQQLTAESAGNTTYFLYGRGAIGEKTTALRQAQDDNWNFSLPDGTNTPRQLTDVMR